MTQTLTRNNVTIKGNKNTSMIFAPGFGFDQTVWTKVSKSFECDYQTILFDYVGFGDSDRSAYDPNRYSTLSGYVDDLIEICSDIELKNGIFVGHSIGAMIGMLASIQRPDLFSKLVLIGPSPYYLNEPPKYYGGFEQDDLNGLLTMMEKNYFSFANSVSTTIVNDQHQSRLAMDIEERFASNDPTITRKFAELVFFSDNRQHLSRVTVPSLILQNSKDVFVPTTVGDYLKEHLPYSTVTYTNTIGHCPQLSHPEETISIIRHFLNEQTEMIGNTGEPTL